MSEVRQRHRRNNEIECSALDDFQVKGDVNNFRDHNDVDSRWSPGGLIHDDFP